MIGVKRLFPVLAVLVLFSMGAVFFALTGPMHHEIGCPFMPGQEVMCTAPLEHLSHWQSSFLAVVWTALAVLGAIVFLVGFHFAPAVSERERIRHKTRLRAFRPTLYEELFARGILNRKEPQHMIA